jgi:hypothetical protein
VPIHRVPFPHSPSSLPPWLAGTPGARLLVAAAPDGASTTAWVGHCFASGTACAPRPLWGVDGVLFPSDVGTTTCVASASSGPPLRSEGAS